MHYKLNKSSMLLDADYDLLPASHQSYHYFRIEKISLFNDRINKQKFQIIEVSIKYFVCVLL